MLKAQNKKAQAASPARAKRKLTRAEKKQIAALIQAAKGDGKPHTAQQTMLPYKTLTFSSIKDRHGVYALIDKSENRDKDIRKPRPSIRAQLAADKGKAAPKKAAKTKNHELEV